MQTGMRGLGSDAILAVLFAANGLAPRTASMINRLNLIFFTSTRKGGIGKQIPPWRDRFF
jgi:hypothetical protein